MKSKVYFVSAQDLSQRTQALNRLLSAVCKYLSYKKDELIPVKITTGDSSCTHNLKAELVKPIISEIKKSKAKPFLFDTTCMYKGRRQNAVDYLTLVQDKGLAYTKVGAPFIISDGLLGGDGRDLEVDFGKVKVPSFIGIVESLLVLTHATGHIVSAYGGAIKNVAMGMSCKSAKQIQHSSLKPRVLEKKCFGCASCVMICPAKAITVKGKKAVINQKLCLGCAECLCVCRFDAISINWQEDHNIFCRRMVDVSSAILKEFKNKFFINFVLDVTKECDCISDKDEPMISGDIGILASEDILSLDRAAVDLINRNNPKAFSLKNKRIYEKMFAYAAQKKLGNPEYELINV